MKYLTTVLLALLASTSNASFSLSHSLRVDKNLQQTSSSKKPTSSSSSKGTTTNTTNATVNATKNVFLLPVIP